MPKESRTIQIDIGVASDPNWQSPVRLIIDPSKLGRLLRKARQSTRGRASAGSGALIVELANKHPMAGQGLLGHKIELMPEGGYVGKQPV